MFVGKCSYILISLFLMALAVVIFVGLFQSQIFMILAANDCGIAPVSCPELPYRGLNGSCNNLGNPQLGMANFKFHRLLPHKYCDGLATPTCSMSGNPLPNARRVSYSVFENNNIPDPDYTLANMQWGQIVAHDTSSVAVNSDATNCCSLEGRLIDKTEADDGVCFPLLIPKNDPIYSMSENECIQVIRTLTDRYMNCDYDGGPTEQINVVTSYMDLSLVYGISIEQNRQIRSLKGGRMIVEERNGGQWLPDSPNPDNDCVFRWGNEICYLAGDYRVNQNTGLTVLQILLQREHNRLAGVLAQLNPHWNDTTLFEEARKINIAQYQHIIYYEWLPILLGSENMLKNRLIYQVAEESFVNDYDPSVDPSVLNEHATAAFRFFHTQIQGQLDLISDSGKCLGSLRLSDWFNRPAIIETDDNFSSLIRGFFTQHEALTDNNYDKEIMQYLFKGNRTLGDDLRATDIDRGRQHGLASYNDLREFCGLNKAIEWEDFEDLIDPEIVQKLQELYESPDDVDLIVGGSLEDKVEGTLAGPTFLCISTEQFYRTRVSDRYFYENADNGFGLTSGQLREIRKASFARLICDSGNNITSIQRSAFMTISDSNPMVPCSSIQQIDFSEWIDNVSQD